MTITSGARVPSRKLLTREDRRASILGAAATAFARSGFADTSMADVAAEAGVTRVLLYRHFESKETLYRAVLEQILELLDAAWAELRDADTGDAAMRAHLRAARANPNGYRLLWRHADSEPAFSHHAHEARVVLERIADERVGDTIAPRLRPWAMATLVSTIIESTLAWLDHGDPADDDQFVATATDGMVSLVESWTGAGHTGRS